MKQFFVGFSKWGLYLLDPFFEKKGRYIVSTLHEAIAQGLDETSRVYMYPAKEDMEIKEYCKKKRIALYFVEDGFIRSLSLGSSFFKPASIVMDARGIYFDPTRESDLEYILNYNTFNDALLERAKNLIGLLLKNRISKYNHLADKQISVPEKNIKLVIGQVDNDMSIRKGGYGFDSMKLLQTVKENATKEDFILYKPHPDVVSGIREGSVDEKKLYTLCDLIVTDASLDSCFDVANEVHTITSLSGMEALLRKKKVFTYGMPFYAGWGLTEDLQRCDRRKRTLSMEELVAAAYIVYPKYVSLKTGKSATPEEVLEEIRTLRKYYFESSFFRFKVNMLGKSAVMIRKIRDII